MIYKDIVQAECSARQANYVNAFLLFLLPEIKNCWAQFRLSILRNRLINNQLCNRFLHFPDIARIELKFTKATNI